LQIDGTYSDRLIGWPFEVTWAHRDRLFQTTGTFDDYTTGDIGPEDGTTYIVRVTSFDVDGELIEINLEATGISGTSLSIDEGDLDLPVDPATDFLRLEVISERDEFTSWTVPHIDLFVLIAPSDFTLEEIED
jgi:hypothetical protein